MTDAPTGATQAGGSRPAGVPGTPRPAQRLGELIFAGLVFALGVYTLVGVFGIRVPANARVGPTVFPVLVSIILLVSSAAVFLGALRGRSGTAEEGEDVDTTARTDWLTLAKVVGLLVAHLLLIDLIGWAPAATILFGGVAWALGAKRWWVALLIGVGLSLAVQIVFGELLGLSLPLGPALGWLGGLL